MSKEEQTYHSNHMKKELILQRLRLEGCRITRQRKLILDIILEENCSSCKEIFFRVQEKDKTVGTATVYRMINTLEKIGAISRKNMYRISGAKKEGCVIRLSDHTSYTLGEAALKEVVRCGMRQLGYIEEQEILSIDANVV